MMRDRSEPMLPSLGLAGPNAVAEALAVGGFLILAVVLGGSSASGITANAILQVAAVVALAATLGWGRSRERGRAERVLLILGGLLVLLFVIQSTPLPPSLWTMLPGREQFATGFVALGLPLPWLPLTLAPEKTLYSGLALLPPIAMFLMVGTFARSTARVAVLALLAIMLVSVLMGVAQVAGATQLYLYTFTNGGSAVGFFANANHLGTLMCVTMPLVAGLVARWRSGSERGPAVSRVLAMVLLLGVVLLALLGITMTKSIASVLLALLSVTGSAAIVLSGLSRRVRLGFLAGVVLAVVVAAGIVVSSNGTGDFDAGALHNSEMGRREMWRTTRLAIAQFGVAGSGFGSFPQIFHLFEDPEQVTLALANHAHNDLLEFVLEGGMPGALLLVAFLIWFGMRFVAVWLMRQRDPLAQGASVGILVMLLHSLVDYPLRTAAIAALFGLCLALLARQPGRTQEEPSAGAAPARHLSA